MNIYSIYANYVYMCERNDTIAKALNEMRYDGYE